MYIPDTVIPLYSEPQYNKEHYITLNSKSPVMLFVRQHYKKDKKKIIN